MTARRLLVISDGAASTGFSRVVEEIFSRIGQRWSLHQLLLNHRRRPRREPLWPYSCCDLAGDPGGFERLRRLLPELEPELIFILYDPRVAGLLAEEIRRWSSTAPVVVYTPVEGAFIHPPSVRRLALADRLVPFTRFGADQLARVEDVLRRDGSNCRLRQAEIVPHGVDTRTFHPLSGGRSAARRALFPARPELDGAFLVLNANRNQPRKRIDLTLEGFTRFVADRSDAYLCLHMGRRDYGVDLMTAARRLGIAERVLLTQDGQGPPDFSEERLNLVYNACDVGLNTSMGEGWGLISFEHACTGAAQIVPDHSVGPELWGEAALRIAAPTVLDDPRSYMELRVVDSDGVAAALGRLYDDRALLSRLSKAAQRQATRAELAWDRVAERFDDLFRDTLAGSAATRRPRSARLAHSPTATQHLENSPRCG